MAVTRRSEVTRLAITGRCLCGGLRYAASAPPLGAGFCCCADCRHASGAGAIPFMNFAATDLTITGAARQHIARALRGGEAVRNFCPDCGGLVFGGRYGIATSHTIYAGSLDDTAHFRPTMAIFVRDKPDWLMLPEGSAVFGTMPG